MLTQEWRDWSHKLGRIQEDIKESVKGDALILSGIFFTLHPRSVKSDVPVGKVFQKLEDVLDDRVKPVVIHLFTHISYKMLVSCDDVPIHKIGVDVALYFEFELRLKNEVTACPLLPSSNVLDQESVSVEPRQKNVTHNSLDSVS